MKKVLFLSMLCVCFVSGLAWAAPNAPEVSYETDGLNITVNWSAEEGATGYNLYYAPYPFTGEDTIGHFDMEEALSFSVDLWEGAAYYIAVKAYNDEGESDWSNIELFTLEAPRLEVTVTGLNGSVDIAHGADSLSLTEDGTYMLSSDLIPGTQYSVSILSQPTEQTCSVVNKRGIVETRDIDNVFINCIAYSDDSTELPTDPAEANLVAVANDSLTFSSLPEDLNGVGTGDVIYSGQSDQAPQGLLRKVTSVEMVNGQVVISTEDGALTDVIENGGFSYKGPITANSLNIATMSKALGPHTVLKAVSSAEDYCRSTPTDFVLDFEDQALGNGISIGGCLGFDMELDFGLNTSWGIIEGFRFIVGTTHISALEVTSCVGSCGSSWSADYEIPAFSFPVPNPIVPVFANIDLVFSITGNGSATMRAGIGATLNTQVGVVFPLDENGVVLNAAFDVDTIGPELSASAGLEAGFGPQCSLLIAQIAGPTLSVTPYLTLNADISNNPWWILRHGGKATLDFEISLNRIPGLGWVPDSWSEYNYQLGERDLWGPYMLAQAETEYPSEEIDNDLDGFSEDEGDCDDTNDNTFPGAMEICGDNIDQDCNGSDLICAAGPDDIDNDNDGFTENEGDCNDTDSSIYPGATDIPNDGIDQDCIDGDAGGGNNSGLIAHFPFEGDGSDTSGNGYHGTSHGNISYVQGHSGQAASFDGVNDFFELANVIDFDNYSEQTITAWVRSNVQAATTRQTITATAESGTYPYGQFLTFVGDDKTFQYSVRYTGNSGATFSSQSQVSNAWTHVAFVKKSSGQINIFINGQLDSTFSQNPGFNSPPHTAKTTIGAYYAGSTPVNFFNGLIDELFIYNRALSSTEILSQAQQ